MDLKGQREVCQVDRTNRALQPEQRETPGLGGLDSDVFGELVREDRQGPGRDVGTLPRRPGVPKPGQSSAWPLEVL